MNLASLALIVVAAYWLLGSAIYVGYTWPAALRDLRTPGARMLVLIDLLIVIAWPLLLIIDLMMRLMRYFVRARNRARR